MLITFLNLIYSSNTEQTTTTPRPTTPKADEKRGGSPLQRACEEIGEALADAAKNGELPY